MSERIGRRQFFKMAALSAGGTSQVYGIEHIERGYENLHLKLQDLGAKIERMAGSAE